MRRAWSRVQRSVVVCGIQPWKVSLAVYYSTVVKIRRGFFSQKKSQEIWGRIYTPIFWGFGRGCGYLSSFFAPRLSFYVFCVKGATHVFILIFLRCLTVFYLQYIFVLNFYLCCFPFIVSRVYYLSEMVFSPCFSIDECNNLALYSTIIFYYVFTFFVLPLQRYFFILKLR